MRRFRRSLLLFAAWPALFWVVPAALAEPARDDVRERVDVRRVRMPVILEDRIEGGCDDLDPALVRLLENGVEARVSRVERRRSRGGRDGAGGEILHAILMDTSSSMDMKGLKGETRLDEATAAALDYLDSLPRDEAALLATFDDKLVLRGRLPADEADMAARLGGIETGWHTTLWESVLQMVAYLRSRPERTVLVLLSDGCDSQGLAAPPSHEVIELAGHSENLTIFTIGISLTGSYCKGKGSNSTLHPSVALNQLANRTGGEFYSIDGAGELNWVLPRIRERLDQEGFVVYEPPVIEHPEGEAIPGWRRVKVNVPDSSPCRVSMAGAPLRYEGGGPGAISDLIPGESIAALEFDPVASMLRGEVRDRVEDWGWLCQPDLYREKGKIRRRRAARTAYDTRGIQVLVPSLDRVTEAGSGPGEALELALEAERAGEERPETWMEVPFLVNGYTALGLREELARGLFQVPAYRDWAYGKIRDDRLAMLDVLFGDPGNAGQDDDRLASYREFIRSLDWKPESTELQRYLAAWLGDVPVAELGASLETRIGRKWFDGGTPASREEIDNVWNRLRIWFPPPVEVRQHALLVPGFDPVREVIGFWRVVQPTLRWSGPPDGLLPASPTGLGLLRWMASHEELAGVMSGGMMLRSIDYDPPSGSVMRKLRWRMKETGRGKLRLRDPSGSMVTLHLSDPGRSSADLPVLAYFAPGVTEPTCMMFREGSEFSRTLVAVLEKSKRPCYILHDPLDQER